MPDFEPIIGRYLNVQIAASSHHSVPPSPPPSPDEPVSYRIYFEEAGEGIPLLCLHTAGADSRQFRHLLNDAEVTSRYRVIASTPLSRPSNPPDGWWLRYSRQLVILAPSAIWTALDLRLQ